jgi:drug/metabolite transporter (DMT)-like permease
MPAPYVLDGVPSALPPGDVTIARPDASTATKAAVTASGRSAGAGVATGTAAMVCVGGSVAVSGVLARAPMFTAEGLRYAVACLILLALARLTGRRLVMPRGAEWLWLSGIAVTGLVLFNVALVAGSRHAEPAVLGVAVACVPSLLAVIGPRDWLAVGYLAVAVTAAAFVMWYSSVRRVGASRAGLLTGVAPVAAAAAGVLLGGPAPRPLVWAGIAVVAAGLALGLLGRT